MGILNSNLFWWYLVNTGTVLSNSYFRFKPDYIKPFPIPAFIPEELEQSLIEYVDKITESNIRDTYVDNTYSVNKINDIVYSIYLLTEEEIKQIENSKH